MTQPDLLTAILHEALDAAASAEPAEDGSLPEDVQAYLAELGELAGTNELRHFLEPRKTEATEAVDHTAKIASLERAVKDLTEAVALSRTPAPPPTPPPAAEPQVIHLQPIINITMPEQPQPIINIQQPPPPASKSITFQRDGQGRISGADCKSSEAAEKFTAAVTGRNRE